MLSYDPRPRPTPGWTTGSRARRRRSLTGAGERIAGTAAALLIRGAPCTRGLSPLRAGDARTPAADGALRAAPCTAALRGSGTTLAALALARIQRALALAGRGVEDLPFRTRGETLLRGRTEVGEAGRAGAAKVRAGAGTAMHIDAADLAEALARRRLSSDLAATDKRDQPSCRHRAQGFEHPPARGPGREHFGEIVKPFIVHRCSPHPSRHLRLHLMPMPTKGRGAGGSARSGDAAPAAIGMPHTFPCNPYPRRRRTDQKVWTASPGPAEDPSGGGVHDGGAAALGARATE